MTVSVTYIIGFNGFYIVLFMKYFVLILIALFLLGCTSESINPREIDASSITTFTDTGAEICTENGKPVIRVFSTTWCPHCKWVKYALDDTLKMYVEDGKIIAHHWEVDKGYDTLTFEVEGGVPESEMQVFEEFNPKGSVPTYIFGCKYFRVGNGHEREDDLVAEVAEFKAVIEELIEDTN
jgi:thioredoxin-related protein